MTPKEELKLFRGALDACRERRFGDAANMLRLLVAGGSDDPRHLSFYGLTLVHSGRSKVEGIDYCRRAAARGRRQPQLQMNLARAYCASGQPRRAVQVLRQALRTSSAPEPTLLKELQRLSPRGKPVLGSLDRDHLLNKYLGRFRSRLQRAG